MKFFLYGLAALAILVTGVLFLRLKAYKNPPSVFPVILSENNREEKNIKFVNIAGTRVPVKLALTHDEREIGLSGSKKLPGNEGLLFVFDKPGEYAFWMKDMNFAIDIIWISEAKDGERQVAYIKKDARPDSYPESFGSGVIARYVLEVNSGFSDVNNLKVGDKVEFSF